MERVAMADVKRWTEKFRNATTSVGRSNVLGELALVADDAGNSALKRFILDAAEASTDEADESVRIKALEVFQWLAFPSDRYRQRVIGWVLGRIDRAGRLERVYAITASRLWIHKPRVRARLLRLVEDVREDEGLRALALDCFSRYQPGEAPGQVIKICERLSGDTQLGRTASYVLRQVR